MIEHPGTMSTPLPESTCTRPATSPARVTHLLLLGAAGALFILLGTARFGPATSPDSACYVAAARSLLAGQGLARYDGSPFLHWPPAYPALLAFAGAVGMEPLVAARYVNATAFGMIVVLAGWTLRALGMARATVMVCCVATVLAIPLVHVSVYAWSEVVFILFVLAALLQLNSFGRRARLSRLVWAATFAALACLTRYVGVTVIAAGGAALLGFPGKPLRVRLGYLLTYLGIAVAPLAVWLARNYLISSTLTGSRPQATASFLGNVSLLLNAVNVWFLPHCGPVLLHAALTIAIIALALVGVSRFTRQRREDTPVRWRILQCPFFWFLIIYPTFIVAAASLIAFDPIDNRLTAVLFVPALVMLARAVEGFRTSRGGESGNRTVRRIVGVAGFFWVAYLLTGTVFLVHLYGWKGGGFARPEWRNASIVAFLRAHRPQGELYSNWPEAVYIHAGLPAKHLGFPDGDEAISRWAEAAGAGVIEGRPSYLIWWNAGRRPNTCTLNDIRAHASLEAVHETGDGGVYRVEPKRG